MKTSTTNTSIKVKVVAKLTKLAKGVSEDKGIKVARGIGKPLPDLAYLPSEIHALMENSASDKNAMLELIERALGKDSDTPLVPDHTDTEESNSNPLVPDQGAKEPTPVCYRYHREEWICKRSGVRVLYNTSLGMDWVGECEMLPLWQGENRKQVLYAIQQDKEHNGSIGNPVSDALYAGDILYTLTGQGILDHYSAPMLAHCNDALACLGRARLARIHTLLQSMDLRGRRVIHVEETLLEIATTASTKRPYHIGLAIEKLILGYHLEALARSESIAKSDKETKAIHREEAKTRATVIGIDTDFKEERQIRAVCKVAARENMVLWITYIRPGRGEVGYPQWIKPIKAIRELVTTSASTLGHSIAFLEAQGKKYKWMNGIKKARYFKCIELLKQDYDRKLEQEAVNGLSADELDDMLGDYF